MGPTELCPSRMCMYSINGTVSKKTCRYFYLEVNCKVQFSKLQEKTMRGRGLRRKEQLEVNEAIRGNREFPLEQTDSPG